MSASNQVSTDADLAIRIDASAFSPLPSTPDARFIAEAGAEQATVAKRRAANVDPQLDTSASALLMAEVLVWPTADGASADPVSPPDSVPNSVAEPVANIVAEPESHERDAPSPGDQVAEATAELSTGLENTAKESPAACSASQQPASTEWIEQTPVWEVDRFRWPAMCAQLSSQEGDYFGHAGAKLFEASKQGLKILAVTSTARGEGCTTLAICLARAASAAGARVALLDADLRQPHLGHSLGLDITHGWRNVVTGEIPWTEAAVASLQDGVTVLPAAPTPAPELESGVTGAPRLLRDVVAHFDLLIVDVGPLTSEARSLLGGDAECAVDASIVVRDARHTSEAGTLAIVEQLRMMGVQAVGIAENFWERQPLSAAA